LGELVASYDEAQQALLLEFITQATSRVVDITP